MIYLLCGVSLFIGFVVGFLARHLTSHNYQAALVMNAIAKHGYKGGAVAEMIAPGMGTEIVECDEHKDVCNLIPELTKCHGCKYAGRYVVKI